MVANKFWLSVSTHFFTDKNSIQWGCVQYSKIRIDIEQFIELVKKGYCFCQCFDVPINDKVVQKDKRNDKFKEAYILFIDIDDSIIPMCEFIPKLSHKPTVAYTTPNNYTDKSDWKYRFRLCYLLSQSIKEVEAYKKAYLTLISGIESDIPGFHNKDNCGQSASQQFSGNGTGNCEVWQGDEVYNPYSLISTDPISKSEAIIHKSAPTHIINDASISDFEFMADFNRMNQFDLIRKYHDVYPFFERTPLTYVDGYAILPKNYTQINRKCTFDSFFKDNGELKTWLKVRKVRDGEGRKKKLYTAALIRKQIFPKISVEHLLFNLVCDRTYFYDNSDKELSNSRLLDMAKRVVATPLENIHIPLCRPKEYEIDKTYCCEHGITPNEMKNIVRKRLKDIEIGECYDCSLSVQDNLTILNEVGIKIGKSRLYQWCRENNIPTNPKRSISTKSRGREELDIKVCLAECCRLPYRRRTEKVVA